MGLLGSLIGGMVESAAAETRRKYREMPRNELIAKWKELFADREFRPSAMYQDNSIAAIVDEVYGERIGYSKTWKYQYEQNLRWQAEQKRREEQERAHQEDINAFKEALIKNDMVKDILRKLDELAFDAISINIYDDSVEAYDESEEVLLTIKYIKYGYPKLSDDQIVVLTNYIARHLKLNYEICESGDELELNDAPNGMRSSW